MYLSFSLFLVVFFGCGLALLGVIIFASWKLCWVPWRDKPLPPSVSALSPAGFHRGPPLSDTMAAEKLKDPAHSVSILEAAVKISHTSPDIPADVQLSMKDHFLRRTRMSRQTTEPASSNRWAPGPSAQQPGGAPPRAGCWQERSAATWGHGHLWASPKTSPTARLPGNGVSDLGSEK
ncbi:hypothetical protein COCON_G00177570 [Conger conger]|uniref:Uncharacterized protein n=1 Tax=Conger conger TaxID=82655 RepID=A0A9Q1HR17_CONCO|nr:hypothetical protein COCON_G00177570 [Conger conger]